MAKKEFTKQDTTALKIELAAAAIARENKVRKKHNASRAVLKGKTDALPMLQPSYAPIHLYNRFGQMRSNKFLCGALSRLCNVLRSAGIEYPWSTDGGMI